LGDAAHGWVKHQEISGELSYGLSGNVSYERYVRKRCSFQSDICCNNSIPEEGICVRFDFCDPHSDLSNEINHTSLGQNEITLNTG
jgi:hypothetical protein